MNLGRAKLEVGLVLGREENVLSPANFRKSQERSLWLEVYVKNN